VRLLNQIEAAKNVGNVIEAPDLRLEAILIYTSLVHETAGGGLKRHHATLRVQEQPHKFLAQNAQRLLSPRSPLGRTGLGHLSLTVTGVGVVVVALVVLRRAEHVLAL